MRYDFIILDVFTQEPFGGNQLAVLTDARGLTPQAMQVVAREFNFAETTFVLPPADPAHAAQVRIFTPKNELAFAGHPTVGTACALVISGRTQAGEFVLEEGVGPVPVTTSNKDGVFSARLRLERAPDTSSLVPKALEAAAALSLETENIQAVFCAGMGPRFTFVQVDSREAVDRSQIENQKWRETFADAWAPNLFVFAGDLGDGAELYGRMYAPGLGIPEDPATGAAAAALVGAAGAVNANAEGELRLNIVQGVALGRPSYLSASARFQNQAPISIEVGGSCVLIAEGRIEVPDNLLEATNTHASATSAPVADS
jgi:trans-2,3-dihydro-3-hydroxyanthranilate isomerase